jgi:hypothetical protein
MLHLAKSFLSNIGSELVAVRPWATVHLKMGVNSAM